MRVVVKIHRVAAGGVAGWRERIAAQPPHDDELWRVHLDAMTAEFVRSEGIPDGAEFVNRLVPPRYVWRFASDCWVHFVLKELPSWFRSAGREVVVIDVTDRPPDV